MEEYLLDNLIDQAKEISANAYVPYTNYPVGAALLADSGQIYLGASVDAAGHSGCCAERIALYDAVIKGDTRFTALAVYSDGAHLPFPCGTCLQALSEFCPDQEMDVIVTCDDDMRIYKLKELLPNPFIPLDD